MRVEDMHTYAHDGRRSSSPKTWQRQAALPTTATTARLQRPHAPAQRCLCCTACKTSIHLVSNYTIISTGVARVCCMQSNTSIHLVTNSLSSYSSLPASARTLNPEPPRLPKPSTINHKAPTQSRGRDAEREQEGGSREGRNGIGRGEQGKGTVSWSASVSHERSMPSDVIAIRCVCSTLHGAPSTSKCATGAVRMMAGSKRRPDLLRIGNAR